MENKHDKYVEPQASTQVLAEAEVVLDQTSLVIKHKTRKKSARNPIFGTHISGFALAPNACSSYRCAQSQCHTSMENKHEICIEPQIPNQVLVAEKVVLDQTCLVIKRKTRKKSARNPLFGTHVSGFALAPNACSSYRCAHRTRHLVLRCAQSQIHTSMRNKHGICVEPQFQTKCL